MRETGFICLVTTFIAISQPVNASDDVRIAVGIRSPDSLVGGVSSEVAFDIRSALERDSQSHSLIDLSIDSARSDFELLSNSGGALHLIGPEGRLRNSFASGTDPYLIVDALLGHARQKALLQMKAEGATDSQNNSILELSLERVYLTGSSDQCVAGLQDAAQAQWQQARRNAEQIVPLCHAFRLRVKLNEAASAPLIVGGVALSNDGSIYDISSQGQETALQPGDEHVFSDIYQGTPPLNVQDRFIVFGAPTKEHIVWNRLAAASGSGSFASDKSGGPDADASWTVSEITVRVLANLPSVDPDAEMSTLNPKSKTRELTVSNFNIGPYLPYRASPTLHRVLLVADDLTYYALKDGVGYKQHGWAHSNDHENLQVGIDCSRSIWYAFTRANLPYNTGNKYLTTADMAHSESPMAEHFQSCKDETEHQTGDILVYRNAANTKGHTVMVIDPERRIAWGSHYWDGANPGLGDNGVEYQQINLSKRDWPQWDTSTTLKQCWRYKDFIAEREISKSEPVNIHAIESFSRVCKDPKSCGSFMTELDVGDIEEGIILLQEGEEFFNRGMDSSD